MHLLLLGSPTLQTDEGDANFDTRKSLALLAYLALHDQPFQRDTLAALFWPDLDQSRARAALRRTLTPLNQALGETALLATRETLALNPDFNLWVDARAFAAAVQRAHAAHSETEPCLTCLQSLQTAVSLYKGDFMAGFTLRDTPGFDEWQFFEADRLRRLYANALERLIPLLTATGEPFPAIEHARRWLALDPLHEPAHRALMRLYAQTNQRAAALRQYRECVRIFDEELGVVPLEETRRLYEEILENRVQGLEIGYSVLSKSLPQKAQAETPGVQSKLDSPSPVTPGSNPQYAISTTHYPLTGRTSELTTLLTTYTRPSPDGYLIGIEGEAGIGKTRLAEEFLAQAQARGAISITARCYRGEEQLAYAPFLEGIRNLLGRPDIPARLAQVPAHALSEVTRLLPELAQFAPALSSPPATSSQLRLFESLRQILRELVTGPQTGLLFLDDMQWADSASLDFLSYLVRRLLDFPLFIVAAWRNEGEVQRLEGILAESQRTGLGARIKLARLTRADVEILASSAQEQFPSLFEETEGLPFFVVEYLNAARQQRDWLPSVQNLERTRLAGLSETARQVLTTAAIIGRSFDFETLHEVSGRSEDETLLGLESLIARGLLTEHHSKESSFTLSYDFTHEKIRTVVYEDTSLTRRRLLHRRVAEVLVNGPRPSHENAARIAHHFQRAGQDPEAAAWYHRAGDYARSLYANTESLSHYQTALALGHPEPCALHESIGDLLTLQGDYRAASASYETAAALAQPQALARIEHKLANLHHRRGDYALAASFFQSAWEAPETPERVRAQVLADWSRTCARQGDHARAHELAEAALRASEAGAISTGQAHNVLGMLARQTGGFTRAAEHLQQALHLAETANHLPAQIAALNNLALVHEEQENYPRAVELAQAALDLCTRLGDRHREAALRNRLADLFHASGQPTAAMYHLKKAVEIFAEIGVEAGELEPEIWKLTEW